MRKSNAEIRESIGIRPLSNIFEKRGSGVMSYKKSPSSFDERDLEFCALNLEFKS